MSTLRRPLLIGSALFLLFIQGCTTAPPSPEPVPAETPGQALSEIEQLLLQAETSTPLARAEYTLLAAERLAEEGSYTRASRVLEGLNPMYLNDTQHQRLNLLRAELALANDDPEAAQRWLDQVRAETLSEALYQRWAALRTQTQLQIGDASTALKALIAQSAGLTEAQQAELHPQIWAAVQGLDDETLKNLAADPSNDYLLQGWLDLGLVTRQGDRDIQARNQALENWLTLWNLHPAATTLPPQLEQLRRLRPDGITHLAVLLPQSGRLATPARAVVEGIMAAHYQRREEGRPLPRLSFYDSQAIDDLAAFYQSAQGAGVELVIGPLDKELMSQLIPKTIMPIPTLALNYAEQDTGALDLYQLGLSGEDEARQAARRAWNDGHRIALSLTPDTDWGRRIADAFEQQWRLLGGTLAAEERFAGNDFSEKVSRLLSVDRSETRAQTLLQMVTEPFEFETRRRQDADFLFLSALIAEARQIKPTLAFHYAGRLPVYATSHVFDGEPAPLKNQDLDGIRFADTPWILNNDNPLRASLLRHRDNARSRFGKLYALGADAYRVAPYLNQLQALPDSYLQGQTGRLQVDPQGRLSRELDWALFRDGKVRRLN
ncbi:penicillin-binding protein activator [Motiliproteus sp. SC1-56]|uniref:penicillin-binding protein activator n=1 Tax=Motiliproteus sp. SC1-56 TaxID=2799565 RepID=UPI001A8EB0C1|nr:penicillin-binding protein activator [Motiliproteus sp. SC1-56]